jgi:hypothetical protein
MNSNDELGDLKRLWREASPPGLDVAALRRQVDAETRRHASIIGTVASLNLAALAWILWRVLDGGSVRGWTGLVTALAFSVVVWALTLWLTRGQRTPRDESTAAYLELAIRRSRANVIAAPLGIGLFAASLLIGVWMRTTLTGQDIGAAFRSGPMLVTGGVILPVYSLLLGTNALVHRRRLRRLRTLQQALAAS